MTWSANGVKVSGRWRPARSRSARSERYREQGLRDVGADTSRATAATCGNAGLAECLVNDRMRDTMPAWSSGASRRHDGLDRAAQSSGGATIRDLPSHVPEVAQVPGRVVLVPMQVSGVTLLVEAAAPAGSENTSTLLPPISRIVRDRGT